MEFFVGSYTFRGGPGIARLRLSPEGTLSELYAGVDVANPSYVCESADGRLVYSVMETGEYEGKQMGGVASFVREADGLRLVQTIGSEGTAPCHLSTDRAGKWLFVANYGNGKLAQYALDGNGGMTLVRRIDHEGSGGDPKRQAGPHAHFAKLMPDEKTLLVCDLGLDAVLMYPFDQERGVLGEAKRISFKPGSGPRHLAISKDARWVYVVHELSCEVSAVRLSGGDAKVVQTLSTLEAPCPGNSCAAIALNDAGDRLYASNRGHDSIACFAVGADGMFKRLAVSAVGGKVPRDFAIAGDYIVSANQDSDSLTVLRAHADGTLDLVSTYECTMPVCVKAAV